MRDDCFTAEIAFFSFWGTHVKFSANCELFTSEFFRGCKKRPLHFKNRVWSKIMFCVWLAFAVKIVVAMTAQLNLAWFTRYEPQKLDGDDVTTVSLTRARAV